MAAEELDASPDRSKGYERILIIKPSSLGDIVHALPVLAGLREAHPRAHIAWLVGARFAPLLEGHPLLDEVIRFDRARLGKILTRPRVFADFLDFLSHLRQGRFDLVVDLQGLLRSGFFAYASGARHRVGFAAAREMAWGFYSKRVRCPDSARHAVDRNMCLAAALNLPSAPARFPLGLGPQEAAHARALLEKTHGGPVESFTAVVPGARWETKRWPAEHIAALIYRIHAEGLPRCVLLGSPADREFAERIVAACKSTVVNLVGWTTLRELVALLDLAERVICHDSGPMHIAAALEKPLVAIFGPTDPARTGPYSRAARVVAAPLECAPCQKRRCPLEHHACMRDLTVETVFAQVRKLEELICGPQRELSEPVRSAP